jgi:hypothetical protein
MYRYLHDFNKVKSIAGDPFAPGRYDIKDKVCHIIFLLKYYIAGLCVHSASYCSASL